MCRQQDGMCVSHSTVIGYQSGNGQERICGCLEAVLDLSRGQSRIRFVLLRECSALRRELSGLIF